MCVILSDAFIACAPIAASGFSSSYPLLLPPPPLLVAATIPRLLLIGNSLCRILEILQGGRQLEWPPR